MSGDGSGFIRRAGRLALIVGAAVVIGLGLQQVLRATLWAPGEPANLDRGRTSRSLEGADRPQVVATGLEVPWEIRFLPGGDLLVTERAGRLIRLAPDGTERGSHTLPDVRATGEGGLMGLALHPDFAENRWIYVCFTTDLEGGLTNRVERYRLDEGLSDRTPVVAGMPGARFHNGCRLEFGPDGHLWVTMGDATDAGLGQDPSSLAGSILRVTDAGEPAPGNPFGHEVFSYGHRNPQGLAFDERGRLWSTEHGRSGTRSGMDEVNLVESGRNYGWPTIEGGETAPDMVAPVVHSGPDVTWAPAGAAWAEGSVFFAGLRGAALYELPVGSEEVELDRLPSSLDVIPHFHREYGRLRAVRIGPDGLLYFATSNRDGRGNPSREDDRILRVDPGAL